MTGERVSDNDRAYAKRPAEYPVSTPAFRERVFPSVYSRTLWPSLEWVALLALLLFATCQFLFREAARVAEVLLLAVTLLSAFHIWRGNRDRWLYLAPVAFFVFTLAVNAWATLKFPEELDHLSYSRQYTRMFLFLLAGWWLGARERNVLLLFAAAVGGLMITIAVEGGTDSWRHLLDGERVDFGLRNAQHTGVLFGSVLIGAACFMFRFFAPRRHHSVRVGLIIAWTAMFAVTLLIVIGAESRQVWLGFAAAIFAGVLFLGVSRPVARFRSRIWLAIVAAFLITGFLTTFFFDSLSATWSSFASDWQAVQSLINGNGDVAKLGSGTVRLLQWQFALDAIADRPWFGYGGATKALLIEQSNLPGFIRSHFGHIHNSYLELWLGYGIIAPLAFISTILGLAWRTISGWRKGSLQPDMAAFGLAWLAFFATVNIFESYVTYLTGYYLTSIIGAGLYSLTSPLPGKTSSTR